MLPRAELWARAAAAVEAGKRAALATVSRTRGSLPMAHDAKMLVTADGERFGTVGGGCTEADVTAQALATWETKSPRVVKHTLNADLAGDIGLSCGGTVEMFVEPLLPSDELAQLCRGVAQAIDSRVAGTVTTGLDWTPGPQKVATAGSKTWQVGSALNPRPSADSFVEAIPRLPRLIVFGAGHVGAEIARVASRCDFHVVVVDDRADFANAERLPFAHEVIAEDFRAVLDRIAIDADDYVIAATRGHGHDAMIVERVAASEAFYVGMLGSKRKQSVIWKALERSGVSREKLDRVKVPIGEDIGADTPAEIAVAVVAELIRLRRA